MTEPYCYLHPDRPAGHCCRNCLNMVCEECLRVGNDTKNYCSLCLKQHQKKYRRIWVSVAIVVIFLSISAGIDVFVVRGYWKSPATGTPFGAREQLQTEPCSRPRALELVESLYRSGDYRKSLQVADRFFANCGEYSRLRWLTFADYFHLGEYDKSISEVTKLIDAEPSNENFWAWRGIVYEERGNLEKALEDFQRALSIRPDLADIPQNIANVYERMGRYCDAIFPLEQILYFNSSERNNKRIKYRLVSLYQRPECADVKDEVQTRLRKLKHSQSGTRDATNHGKNDPKPVPDLYPSEYSDSKHIEPEKKMPQRRVPGFTSHF